MKVVFIALLACAALMPASTGPEPSQAVDIHGPDTLPTIARQLASKGTRFASEPLRKYGNHYTMVAYRDATGSSEIHKTEADLFVVVEGHADLITGGKLVNAHAQSATELRGTSVSGGEKHALSTGSIVHIPAGVPHQLLVPSGTHFTYYVLKVIE